MKDHDHTNWIDSIFQEEEKKGNVNKLPGFGKPLPKKSLEGDIFTNIVKRANYLPVWVSTQKSIHEKIEKAINLLSYNQLAEAEKLVEEINIAIKKYNSICPPSMQKCLVQLEKLSDQQKYWE
ncbi:DnaJ family domain-containing protein [Metabacillus arenae]|uniref:DUF1992 domain-containing protein n=1 Tax=Metabacillus arenae TaxID=2771434 RepID=A0A926RXR7_9BACI|nr:DnaJ family domain-containing protein [Metabacillus arenae]MBD1382173.1 DUF1992 domain-containing protein [Metabacillus arenae]